MLQQAFFKKRRNLGNYSLDSLTSILVRWWKASSKIKSSGVSKPSMGTNVDLIKSQCGPARRKACIPPKERGACSPTSPQGILRRLDTPLSLCMKVLMVWIEDHPLCVLESIYQFIRIQFIHINKINSAEVSNQSVQWAGHYKERLQFWGLFNLKRRHLEDIIEKHMIEKHK